MSIWKSPTFYFGMLLSVIVTLALASPYIVDWNGYKPGLEEFGKRLTGRQVTIGGDVEIRLFPWPSLTAEDVKVGNPDGFTGAPLISAQEIKLRLELGGLLNGQVDVQSVEIIEPKVALIRETDGRVNWTLGSDDSAMASTLLDQVRLDQIQMVSGALRLEDRMRGININLTTVDAEMSAPSLEGPWRVKGTGNWREVPLSVNLTTAEYKPNEALKFGLKVLPGDTAFPGFGLDGAWQGEGLDANLRIDPQEPGEEKGSAARNFRPLTLQGKLKIDRELVELESIRITPKDSKESGTLVEGRAMLNIASAPNAFVELKAPRLNLDALMGVESLALVKAGGLPALTQTLLRNLPNNLKAEVFLDAGVLTSGGETFQDVLVKASADNGRMRVSELRMGLPGRSAMRFVGDMAPVDGSNRITGRLDFESNDLRSFARWAVPESAAQIDANWKGSRGRYKMIAQVALADADIGIKNWDFELDGQPGKGELLYSRGAQPTLDLKLDIAAIDLDDLVPDMFHGGSGSGRAFDLLGYVAPLISGNSKFETTVIFESGAVTANGAIARDVAIDFAAGLKGLEVKAFDIGSVEGATLKGRGLVLNDENGPSGDFTSTLVAKDPRGFLQLLGFADVTHRWPDALGTTDLNATFNVKPSANGPVVEYLFKGKSGVHAVNVSGDISALDRGSDARVTVNGKVASSEASRLLQIFGLTPKKAITGSGKTGFALSGSRTEGFSARFEGEAAGAKLTYDGTLKAGEPYSGIGGTANLIAKEASGVAAALGLPVKPAAGGVQMSARLVTENQSLKFQQVFGSIAKNEVSAEVELDKDGKLMGEVQTGPIALTDIAAIAFLPWEGKEATLESPLSRTDEALFQGAFKITPTTLRMPYGPEVEGATVTININDVQQLAVDVKDNPLVGLGLTLAPRDGAYDVQINGTSPVNIAGFLSKDGAPWLTGTVQMTGNAEGRGRSPAAIISTLSGKAMVRLNDAALARLQPAALASRLGNINSSEDMEAALKTLEEPGSLSLGSSEVALVVEKGNLKLDAVRFAGEGTESEFNLSSDLAAGTLATKATVNFTGNKDLPPVSITYEGEPGALSRRAATADLAVKLGHEILAKNLNELEKLQAEEEKLAAAEEAQREVDEEKFEAYQANRAELRLRNRELKIHAETRVKRVKVMEAQFAAFLPEAEQLNKADLNRGRLKQALVLKLQENREKLRAKREEDRAAWQKQLVKRKGFGAAAEEERKTIEAIRIRQAEARKARIEAERKKQDEERMLELRAMNARAKGEVLPPALLPDPEQAPTP